jgi:uncharacterized protein YjbI with pentapeptide repeats
VLGQSVGFYVVLVTLLMGALQWASPRAAHAASDCRASPGPKVDWQGCTKKNLMLSSNDFSNGNLRDVDLSFTDLRDSNFNGTDFTKAKLIRTWFAGSKAQRADFEKIEAYRAGFQDVDATGAFFSSAELERSNFTGAMLAGADFSKAELSRAIFDKAEITGVNFSSANLARADFTKAKFAGGINFTDAFLSLTRLEGVDLSMSTGLDQHQLNIACGDAKTKLPKGMTMPLSWPCGETD